MIVSATRESVAQQWNNHTNDIRPIDDTRGAIVARVDRAARLPLVIKRPSSDIA